MRKSGHITTAIAPFLAIGIAAAATADENVAIGPDGDAWRVKSPRYEAVVGNDGCLSSLSADGAEFLKSTPRNIPRGFYLFQDGLIRISAMAQPAPGVLTGACDRGAIRYQFDTETITITVTNHTPKPLLLVGVFDTTVSAVLGERNRFAKTPTKQNWKTTTWFRDRSNLRISGGLRIWGPWSGNHQVWQTDLAPHQSAVVTLEPSVATAEQIAKAIQTAQAPPPAPPTDPVGPMWDMSRLSTPPKSWPSDDFKGDGARAVFFEGPPYQGRPTRVFAWIGLPKMAPGKKVPGMVLVHGGGGTAFDSWVRRWTSRGYAAIAMDTCGCVPKGKYGHWESHDAGGPPGWGGYDQIDEPREDQWAYHAVADAILAHSLLRSLPEVDPLRTGLTGISWGGYLTCLIASVDHRFKFAVPVYGCGFTTEHSFAGSVNGLGPERAARWMRWWDPSSYLKDAPMPMLWVTGTNDFAYTLNALQKSYRLPGGPRILCVRLRMPHGHGDAGEGPKEIFTFADSILKDGEPLAKITGQQRDGRQITATFESKRPITKAELMVTRATGRWPDRSWEPLPAQLGPKGTVSATLPENVTVCYMNLFDDRDCVVSTEHEELTTSTATSGQ